jgi:aminoacrylate hydrolase
LEVIVSVLATQGISQYYELHGDPANPPVLLVTGLGGVGTSWGPQIQRFATRYHVILPDQRGTGRTTRAADGYTTDQLAADMAALVEHLGRGPVHVVGESTGGAIGQYMALNHPDTVRSLTMSSSFARFDAYAEREFQVRRALLADSDRETVYSLYALLLFSPRYTRAHPEKVQAWIDRVLAQPVGPQDLEIALKRTDMIIAHDTLPKLGAISQPTLVLCGDQDACTPLPLSEEITDAIPGAQLVVFRDGGHLLELEQEEEYFQIVSSFIDRQDG